MNNNKYIYIALLTLALSGCATPAAVDQMTARKIDQAKINNDTQLKNSLSIKSVTGGQSTNPLWVSKVGNDNFKQALEESLKNASLLSSADETSAYLLDAKLISLDQPLAGLDLKVTASVEYSLVEKATGQKIYSKLIATPFTATFSDAALAFVRLKIANEGAIRENLEKVIDELLVLQVSKQQISVK